MQNMKMGIITQILEQDNLGLIREESTLTEWLFFLDETSETFRSGMIVAFYRDDEYEQFVASDVTRISSNTTKWAV